MGAKKESRVKRKLKQDLNFSRAIMDGESEPGHIIDIGVDKAGGKRSVMSIALNISKGCCNDGLVRVVWQ